MRDSKYKPYYYWENLIMRDEEIWEKSFRNMSLTKDSIFVNTVIVNCYTNLLHDRWVYYPNVKSALGFLHHVFLTSAFDVFLIGNDEGLPIPLMTAYELLNIAEEGTECKKKHLIPIMRYHELELENLWDLEDQDCYVRLKDFSIKYTEQWNREKGVFSYFNIYRTPMELGENLIRGFEEEGMLDIFESQTGFNKDQWEEVCNNVYDNEFLRNKFMDILNYKISDLI